MASGRRPKGNDAAHGGSQDRLKRASVYEFENSMNPLPIVLQTYYSNGLKEWYDIGGQDVDPLADKPGMERRTEPRVDFNEELRVTVLGQPDSEAFKGSALDLSGSGMRLLSPVSIPCGAPVKVEIGDFLLLGEVIRVQASAGGHAIALKLMHSLDVTVDLYRLNDAIGGKRRAVINQRTGIAAESRLR